MLILLARHCEGDGWRAKSNQARSNLPPKTSPDPSKGGELVGLLKSCSRHCEPSGEAIQNLSPNPSP